MKKIIRMENNTKLEQLKKDIKLGQLMQNQIAIAKMNQMIDNPALQ